MESSRQDSTPREKTRLCRSSSSPRNQFSDDFHFSPVSPSRFDDSDLNYARAKGDNFPLKSRQGLNSFSAIEEEPGVQGDDGENEEYTQGKLNGREKFQSLDESVYDLHNFQESSQDGDGGFGEESSRQFYTPTEKESDFMQSPRLNLDFSRSSEFRKSSRHGGKNSFSHIFPYSDSQIGEKRFPRTPSDGYTFNFLFEATKEKVDRELRIFADDVALRIQNAPETLHMPVTRKVSMKLFEDDDNEESDEQTTAAEISWVESAKKLQSTALLCEEMPVEDFALVAENFVRDLNASRAQLEPGSLNQLHSRLLFILTRCTRVLQLQRDFGLREDASPLSSAQFATLTSPRVARIAPASPARNLQYRASRSMGAHAYLNSTLPRPAPWHLRDPRLAESSRQIPADWRARDPLRSQKSVDSGLSERRSSRETYDLSPRTLQEGEVSPQFNLDVDAAGAGQAALLAKKMMVWKKRPSFRPRRKTSRLAGKSETVLISSKSEGGRNLVARAGFLGRGRSKSGELSVDKNGAIVDSGSQEKADVSKVLLFTRGKEKSGERDADREIVDKVPRSVSFDLGRKESHEEDIAAAVAVDTWDKDEEYREAEREGGFEGHLPKREQQEDKREEEPVEVEEFKQEFWQEEEEEEDNIEDDFMVLCRICEEDVRRGDLEDHSKYCELADECNTDGLSLEDRLGNLAEMLKRMVEDGAEQLSFSSRINSDVRSQENELERSGLQGFGKLEEAAEHAQSHSQAQAKQGMAVPRKPLSSEQAKQTRLLKDEHSKRPISAVSSGGSSPATMISTMGSSLVSSYLSDTPSAEESSPKSGVEDSHLPGTEDESMLERERALLEIESLNQLSAIAAEASSVPQGMENSVEMVEECLEQLTRLKQENLDSPFMSLDIFAARTETLIRDKLLLLKTSGDSNSVEGHSYYGDCEVPSARSTPLHQSAQRQVSIKDFHIIKRISKGAYGRVFLAQKKTTRDFFAIKILRKADMIRKNAVESVQAERNILVWVNSPFVVRFFFSFTCETNLYLVMEYLNGGDVFSLLRNLGCLDQPVARQYIAELVCALEYVHSLGIVHRDLKPDNLLIGRDGHIKLTDFGLSKIGLVRNTGDFQSPNVPSEPSSPNPARAQSPSAAMSPPPAIWNREVSFGSNGRSLSFSSVHNSFSVPGSPINLKFAPGSPHFHPEDPNTGTNSAAGTAGTSGKQRAVGTPDYLAPEILLGTEHGPSADWWSVGVILFEFLTGVPPFNAPTPEAIFENILNQHIAWPQVPEDMSYEAQDLISKLLQPDPRQRLGYRGAEEVRAHAFFRGVNWASLPTEEAAFVPEVEHPTDTSYFTSRQEWTEDDNAPTAAHSDSDSDHSACTTPAHSTLPPRGGAVEEEGERFSNFSFKNFRQLASINHDIAGRGGRQSPGRDFSSPGRHSPFRSHSVYNSPRRDFLGASPGKPHSVHASPAHHFLHRRDFSMD